jgi:hypothetical protein
MRFIIKDGRRLCHDDKLREHATFGSMSSCVRTYKTRVGAFRKRNSINAHILYAKSQGRRLEDGLAQVVEIPEGWSIDAVGEVSREVPAEPGFTRHETAKLTDFIVDPVVTAPQGA